MDNTRGLPINQVGLTGTGWANATTVKRQTAGYRTLGGIIDPAEAVNIANPAYFGSVVSRKIENSGLFALGVPGWGYMTTGVLVYDSAVGQNEPAKSDYVLAGLPATVIYEGEFVLQNWSTTQTGALASPDPYSLIIYRMNSDGTGNAPVGSIEFLPGTANLKQIPPAGWGFFPGHVVQNRDIGNGVVIRCDFSSAINQRLYGGTYKIRANVVMDSTTPTFSIITPGLFPAKKIAVVDFTMIPSATMPAGGSTLIYIAVKSGDTYFDIPKSLLYADTIITPRSNGVVNRSIAAGGYSVTGNDSVKIFATLTTTQSLNAYVEVEVIAY